MKRSLRITIAAILFFSTGCLVHAEDKAAVATSAISTEQQKMMEAFQRMGEVRAEHTQLRYFAGDWNASTTLWMDPKAPPEKSGGKSHATAIMDGRFIETHYQGEFSGQPFVGQGILGFDNLKGKYFNTWLDSMSTGHWMAWGDYDAATKAYTFRGEMQDPMVPKTMLPIRQVVRIVDDNHYVFEWYEMRAGKEIKTMQIDYTRQ